MLQYKIFSRHAQNWYNNPTILILNTQPLLPYIYMAGIIIIQCSHIILIMILLKHKDFVP